MIGLTPTQNNKKKREAHLPTGRTNIKEWCWVGVVGFGAGGGPFAMPLHPRVEQASHHPAPCLLRAPVNFFKLPEANGLYPCLIPDAEAKGLFITATSTCSLFGEAMA